MTDTTKIESDLRRLLEMGATVEGCDSMIVRAVTPSIWGHVEVTYDDDGTQMAFAGQDMPAIAESIEKASTLTPKAAGALLAVIEECQRVTDAHDKARLPSLADYHRREAAQYIFAAIARGWGDGEG